VRRWPLSAAMVNHTEITTISIRNGVFIHSIHLDKSRLRKNTWRFSVSR
jgi:hypothetical protein